MHIFSAPEGIKKIYTDSDTEIEKHINQYESLKKIAIPSSICLIILLILMAFAKNNDLLDAYKTILLVISIPISAVSVFTTIPCLNHYIKINELQKMSDLDRKHKISKFLIINLIILISLIVLMGLKVASISIGLYWLVFHIIILVSVYRRIFVR